MQRGMDSNLRNLKKRLIIKYIENIKVFAKNEKVMRPWHKPSKYTARI